MSRLQEIELRKVEALAAAMLVSRNPDINQAIQACQGVIDQLHSYSKPWLDTVERKEETVEEARSRLADVYLKMLNEGQIGG